MLAYQGFASIHNSLLQLLDIEIQNPRYHRSPFTDKVIEIDWFQMRIGFPRRITLWPATDVTDHAVVGY